MFGLGIAIWPELRSAYKTQTGLELARQDIGTFVGYVIEYYINTSDYAGQKREAFYKAIHNEAVAGAEFEDQADTMWGELDQLESQLREGVE